MRRVALLAALLLPCTGCLAFFPDARTDIPDGKLRRLDPAKGVVRRPTVKVDAAGVAYEQVKPLFERSELFGAVEGRGGLRSDVTDLRATIRVSTKFVGTAWRALGLIPGLPLPVCYQYTAHVTFFGLTGEKLGHYSGRRRVEAVLWSPLLVLNLIMTVVPGHLGLDVVDLVREQRVLVGELVREVLWKASQAQRFDAVPVPELIKMVAAPGNPFAVEARNRLSRVTRAKGAELEALLTGLSHANLQVRIGCQDALIDSGIDVLPSLIELLAKQDAELRRGAAQAIGAIHLGGDPLTWRPSMKLPRIDPKLTAAAVRALGKALDDARAPVRQAAAYALALIGEPAQAVIEQLARAATDPDWSVARQAVFAIGRTGAATPLALESLSDYLDPPTAELRKRLRALWDPQKNLALRSYVATSLVATTSGVRLPITARLVKEGSGRHRYVAEAESTGQLTQALHARADHADWRVRRAVVLALGELSDPKEGRAKAAIGKAKQDPDARVRRAAEEAAKRLQAPSKSRRY